MRTVRLLAIASALTLGTSVLAGAQDHGRAGVTIGYPGDVGVLWHASDSIAIRPVFTFNHSSSESGGGSRVDGWGTGFGLSALFYLKKIDNVRTYVSPQFTYAHNSSTSTPPSGVPTAVSVDASGSSTGGNGAFGVQYTPSPHFAVYGELGVAFAHQKTTFTPSVSTGTSNKSTAWGSFAGVGIVFYP